MRTKAALAILVALVAGVLAWSWWSKPLEDRQVEETAGGAPSIAEHRSDAAAEPTAAAPSRDASQSVERDEGTSEIEQRAEFEDRARAFFAQAPAMEQGDRTRQAQRLSNELSRYEKEGVLSAGEAFLMGAALVLATTPDEEQQAAQITALKERYARDAERRTLIANARTDPAFDLYKAREKEIVAEVMAMREVPDGLSRDEYLRQRLQHEREQLMGGAL